MSPRAESSRKKYDDNTRATTQPTSRPQTSVFTDPTEDTSKKPAHVPNEHLSSVYDAAHVQSTQDASQYDIVGSDNSSHTRSRPDNILVAVEDDTEATARNSSESRDIQGIVPTFRVSSPADKTVSSGHLIPSLEDDLEHLEVHTKRFIHEVAPDEFSSCTDFITNNHGVLLDRREDLEAYAMTAYNKGSHSIGSAFVQLCLHLQEFQLRVWQEPADEGITDLLEYKLQYVDRLNNMNDDEIKQRLLVLHRNCAHVKELARKMFSESAGKITTVGQTKEWTQRQRARSDSLSTTRSMEDFGSTRLEWNDQDQAATTVSGHKQTFTDKTTGLPLGYFVPKKGHEFFITGRVFKVLWVAQAGRNRAGQLNRCGNLALGSFSYGRHWIHGKEAYMLVIWSKHGYSICCPVNTYSKQGPKKPGFNKADIRAHAPMCSDTSKIDELHELCTEVGIGKYPVPLQMYDEEASLHPMTLVHLGKFHTVEWNVGVRNVGMVPEAHHKTLRNWCQTEMQRRQTQEQQHQQPRQELNAHQLSTASQPQRQQQPQHRRGPK